MGPDINTNRVELFWKRRSAEFKSSSLESVTNFEVTNVAERMELEKKAVFGLVDFKSDWRVLDLGAGNGVWSAMIAPLVNEIIAVEYMNAFIEKGKDILKRGGFNNVRYIHARAEDFVSEEVYDLVYTSGLLLYMNDCDLMRILQNMSYLNSGGYVLLRESTAVDSRYVVDNEYSVRLKQDYSAVYRTREEFENIFNAHGFRLLCDSDVFPKDSPYDKFKETKLRVYLFVKM